MLALRSLKDVQKYSVSNEEGTLGSIYSFFFNDMNWLVMYVVVDVGGWLKDQRVLLSPALVKHMDWKKKDLFFDLTREEIRNRPEMEEHLPVSMSKPAGNMDVENMPVHWEPILADPASIPVPITMEGLSREEAGGDPHLRSTSEIMGYYLHATDGEIGHVDDIIVEIGANWTIRYFVVDTRNWIPGKKVLVSPNWIREIDWLERVVYLDLTREEVKNSPEFDPSTPVNRDYEEVLYDYYGRPKYWSLK